MKFLYKDMIGNSVTLSKMSKRIPIEVRNRLYGFFNKKNNIRLYFNNNTAVIDLENKNIQGLISVFYWDRKPNFGDFIGPYLISKITGMPVLNVKNLKHPGIMSVGSILHLIDREDMVVWGSGLIEEPTDEVINNLKKYKPRFLSIRGEKTAKYLLENEVDIQNCDTYGDPALILPLFYKPLLSSYKKIGVCPHFKHKLYFLDNITSKDNYNLIDVQNDVETVVDDISSASVCISTSLHGIIIAQAYKIPWVWLEVYDDNLIGDDFKFNDFFLL